LKEGITSGIYGKWLKAENPEFQPGIDLKSLKNSDVAECGTIGGKMAARGEAGELSQGLSSPRDSVVITHEPMDQSESCVGELAEEKVGGEGIGRLTDATDKVACPSDAAMLLDVENSLVLLGEADLVLSELTHSVGPQNSQIELHHSIGSPSSLSVGPRCINATGRPPRSPQPPLGLPFGKRKIEPDDLKDLLVKKARVEDVLYTSEILKSAQRIGKKGHKGSGRGASLKKLACARIDSTPALRGTAATEGESSVYSILDIIAPPNTIQMAEEVGLILPPPSP
jgi:hypothetical protein